MKDRLWFVLACLGATVSCSLSASAQTAPTTVPTNWPEFMPTLQSGPSASPVEAVLPSGVIIEPPGPDVPTDKTKWSGTWSGWACRNETCATKLAVQKIVPDGASIIYVFASANGKGSPIRADGRFVGDELQATLPSGARLAYRMRKDGDLEFLYRKGDEWAAGILTSDAEDRRLKADKVLAERMTKPGPDVPESCARFFGGWAGDWQFKMGQQRLWVLGINADCTAQISYRESTSNAVPASLIAAEIKQGNLAVPCGRGGTCTFQARGDEVYASYTDPFGGRNTAVFQKIK